MIGRNKFASGVADSADTALVLASDWNGDILLGYVLTNRTGGQLTAGDVLAIDPATNDSAILADTLGANRQYVVFVSALPSSVSHTPGSTINDLETGIFLPAGATTVKVAGATTRGNYLRKSATTKALEDMSISGANARPNDALALALTSSGGAGTVKAIVLGASKQTGTQTFRNLYLRTHPDSDQALSKVMLVSADEIVMDDGTRVPDWAAQIADITVEGAGGRDAGSEVASTWYEIFAIRKSSDGTKNLLLHRMKDYFKDQSYEVNDDATVDLRRAGAGAEQLKEAQGFTPATTGPLAYVDVLLAKTGAPTGNIWVTIESNAAGVPSNTVLATSDKLPIASLEPTDSRWIRFYFRTPTTLTASTLYHLVLQGDWAQSDTVTVGWRVDASSPAYAGGARSTSNDGTTWAADATRDFLFRAYITRNDAAVTMPSGYDQKCKIGQVYNKSTSNFARFYQRDRWVEQGDVRFQLDEGAVVIQSNIADQTNMVDLLAEQGGNALAVVPWNAYKVLLGVEVAYGTLPAATAFAEVLIKQEATNTDSVRALCASTTAKSVGGMVQVLHGFPDVASQRFRWQLSSTDVATANKNVIIALHGYEWA